MRKDSLKRLVVGLTLLAGFGINVESVAKDYLLAVTRPNKLYLVDTKERKIDKVYDIPGDGVPSTVAVPADGKVAYISTNRWESVSGIDLETGQEVFRANLSDGDLRVKSMFAMNVSRDGKELYVHESPVRLKLDEYEVQDTRIAVYDTSAGLNAKPKRTFAAPRRIALLFPGMEHNRLYGFGWDLYAFNTETGAIDKTFPVLNWQRPNYAQPDILDVWLQYEQANVLSTPYFVTRTDLKPDDPAAFKTGLLTFDLANENFQMHDFEDTSVVIFSSVINPVKPNEAYLVYTTLSKVDLDQHKVVKRVDLAHTYYAVNISSDGKEVYLGGAMDDIAVYDTANLEKLGTIKLPGGADQSVAGVRMVHR